jgi:L-rhamnose-H+ transport protein
MSAIEPKLLWTMIMGGIGFGLGQIAFALSFRYIGIGLAFVINISMGTAGSALIPILWHKGIWGTPYSYAQLIGIIIFVVAVIIGAAAGAARDKNKEGAQTENKNIHQIKPGMLVLGVLLAVLAGIGSVSQGVTYIWANPTVSALAANQFGVSKLASGVIAWVIIFSSAWIPYALYFLILNIKNKSFHNYRASGSCKYWLWLIFMGIGYWGSLVFFSKASEVIGGSLAPTIAWPLFMVFIILTSNFWSWKSHEWDGAGSKAIKTMWASLVLFIAAIVVFSYSSKLQPPQPDTPDDHYHDVHYKHIEHDGYPNHGK